ncbi:flagellar biosynthetic protein FliR [Lutibaculum baratangense]|uniref:Flagellar biosynthetic protein FliR n=1 Tax=Lutibaculum baratangense AMV1 TaxID=631454 RepID=V4RUN7_9HYPH|nr:flagellar biosynthetic protein FliR [Lutibaculum baratangense]ESR26790.1 Flagellar biosynthesis protein FliR [Lutibaculum baratangense AMV1]
MTVDLLPSAALTFLMIFVRVGTLVMLMPVLGETTIPVRVRLVFALVLTLVFYPVIGGLMPAVPTTLGQLLALLFGELVIGFFIGLLVRLVMSALQVAGSVIAMQTGLGFAQSFDASQGQQSAVFSSFLSVLAIALIFVTNLHHLFLAAIFDSYTLFPPGTIPPVEDGLRLGVRIVAESFALGVQISAPFLAFGLIFYFGLGILARLMPQVQVFFVAAPANIMIGFVMFAALLGVMMLWFLSYLENAVTPFLAR